MTALELATTSALVDLWMLLKWQPVPQISLFGRVWIPCQSYYWRMCNRCRDLHQRAHIKIIRIVQDESHRCRDLSPNFNLMGEVPPSNWWHNGTMINATSAVKPDQSLVTFSIMCSILQSDPLLWKWNLTIWYGKGRNMVRKGKEWDSSWEVRIISMWATQWSCPHILLDLFGQIWFAIFFEYFQLL